MESIFTLYNLRHFSDLSFEIVISRGYGNRRRTFLKNSVESVMNNSHCSFTRIGSILVIALQSADSRNFNNFIANNPFYLRALTILEIYGYLLSCIICDTIFLSILVKIISTQESPTSVNLVGSSTVWNMLKELIREQKTAFALQFLSKWLLKSPAIMKLHLSTTY